MRSCCVCIKGKRKGDKFLYEVNKIGDTLGNRQVTFYLYDIKDGMFLWTLTDKSFNKSFKDLQDYRQKQLDEILK